MKYHIFYTPFIRFTAEIVYNDLLFEEARALFITLTSAARLAEGAVSMYNENNELVSYYDYDDLGEERIPQEWQKEISSLSGRAELT